jgi:hypothetical protein
MILLPALIGAALAAATVLLLSRAGMVRSGIVALVVIAVAGFWPLFAVASQNDGQIVLHMTLFATFAAAAVFSSRIGIAGLAIALIAHGILDAALFTTPHPGPLWWPAFCAGYDVTFGVMLLVSLRIRRTS